MQRIDQHAPDLVVLAGFMRILTPGFVAHYAGRLINIHPSLLPAFTGLNTHQRALDAGCKFAGATVHQVTAELDHGQILAQAVVPNFARRYRGRFSSTRFDARTFDVSGCSGGFFQITGCSSPTQENRGCITPLISTLSLNMAAGLTHRPCSP